jgi:hypothetical protein
MTTGKGITLGLALLVSSALASPCMANTIYNFSYSFSGDFSISAMGTLTVGSGDPIDGFQVLAITGTRTVDGVTMNITGLDPTTGPNSFDGNDNLLYNPDSPGSPFLDGDGISFLVDNPSLSDDGSGDVNVYLAGINLDGSGLYLETAPVNPGPDFQVSPASADPTPEPSTTMLMISGLVGLVVVGKRRYSRSC